MIDKLKIKHLNEFRNETINYAMLMVDLDDYTPGRRLGKNKRFATSFQKVYAFIEEIKVLEPKDVEYTASCSILKPNSIDDITFSAMMELQQLIGNPGDRSMPDLMIETISIACYSENNAHDFDVDTNSYKQFKNLVANSNAMHMLGLYNWIDEQITNTTKEWQQRFFSVEVTDKDYEQAGGDRMNQFNVITTIKNTCTDFNVPYKEAWQLSYGLIQTNSYAKATSAHIQSQMTDIKEAKMKARGNAHH